MLIHYIIIAFNNLMKHKEILIKNNLIPVEYKKKEKKRYFIPFIIQKNIILKCVMCFDHKESRFIYHLGKIWKILLWLFFFLLLISSYIIYTVNGYYVATTANKKWLMFLKACTRHTHTRTVWSFFWIKFVIEFI